jgi:hypothetical protein
MARLLPDELDAARARGTASPELHTLDRLEAGLSDEYLVFHGVDWARADDGGSIYGEIDFLVMNRYGRILAIEQKNGRLDRVGEALVKTYATGSRSVKAQVTRNIRNLRASFAQRHPGRDLDVDHLLYCPDDEVVGKLPAGIDPQRVVDASSAAWLPDRIAAIFDARPMPDAANAADPLDVQAFLSDRVEVVPDVDAVRGLARSESRRLSSGLSVWARRLSMTPFRLRVVGTAGSGKTQLAFQELLAAHEARRAAIYICFNRPLAERMRATAPADAMVTTFHELGTMLLHERGQAIDFTSPGAFERIAEAAADAARALSASFDLLIIDEGQDFEPGWADALLGMLRSEGRALWLEDPDQNLYRRPRVELPGWVTLESPVNYRSPRTITTLIELLDLVDRPLQSGSAIHGFDPQLVRCADDDDLVRTADAAVATFLAAGHAPADIAVLGWHGLARSPLAGVERLGARPVRRFTGRYTQQGDAVYTDGEVVVETVHRFKGQSADCVVIAGVDFDAWNEDVRRRLFVAMTRSRLKLTLIVSPAAERLLLDSLET